MSGKLANGIVLKMGSTAPVTIGNVTSFDGPGGSAIIVDATTLASTAMEKLQGLRDEGQFSFEINYSPADASHEALTEARASGDIQPFVVSIPTGEATTADIEFDGLVSGFAVKGAVNALVTASVTIEVTGPVTWPSVD